MIIDPRGEVVALAPRGKNAIVIHEADHAVVRSAKAASDVAGHVYAISCRPISSLTINQRVRPPPLVGRAESVRRPTAFRLLQSHARLAAIQPIGVEAFELVTLPNPGYPFLIRLEKTLFGVLWTTLNVVANDDYRGGMVVASPSRLRENMSDGNAGLPASEPVT